MNFCQNLKKSTSQGNWWGDHKNWLLELPARTVQPMKPIWQQFFALSWSAVKKGIIEIQFQAYFCNLLVKKTWKKKQSNIWKTFCGIDLLYKHIVSKCIYPSYFFIVLYLATYTAFFSHIHGGSSACWGERTWEKWRRFSRSKSFYVNCEDSDSYYEGTSPLKSQNSFKRQRSGQLRKNMETTSWLGNL